jgi:ADP-ribose pyrophosphatase
MHPWKTLSRRTALALGKYLTVELHTVQLPDGRTIPDWPWLITPEYIVALAETADGHYLCFRQTKYGVPGDTLATVGGYLEPGEAPLAAAQRELLEETGYTAPEWRSLGAYQVDGNRGNGMAHLFLARGAVQTAARHADDLEEQELLLLDRPALAAALRAGEFKVLAWAALVALALNQ